MVTLNCSFEIAIVITAMATVITGIVLSMMIRDRNLVVVPEVSLVNGVYRTRTGIQLYEGESYLIKNVNYEFIGKLDKISNLPKKNCIFIYDDILYTRHVSND